jgi:hypothetical protein
MPAKKKQRFDDDLFGIEPTGWSAVLAALPQLPSSVRRQGFRAKESASGSVSGASLPQQSALGTDGDRALALPQGEWYTSRLSSRSISINRAMSSER